MNQKEFLGLYRAVDAGADPIHVARLMEAAGAEHGAFGQVGLVRFFGLQFGSRPEQEFDRVMLTMMVPLTPTPTAL
jgi:hypothetical protein